MQQPAGSNKGPAPIHDGWLMLRHLGRKFFWHDPTLYRWFGKLRGHGDCLATDFDVWIDGFPGSASLLAAASFQKANPAARVAPRRHLPPFILNALYQFKPGMLLVGPPEETVVSWAILSNRPVHQCLDYYLDFHRKLQPNAPWFFVVTPGELMTQLDLVMEVFNLHFQTSYATPKQIPADEIATLEPPAELRVARPVKTAGARKELRRRLQETPALRRKLEAARQLYVSFVPGDRRRPVAPLDVTTRHLPTLA